MMWNIWLIFIVFSFIFVNLVIKIDDFYIAKHLLSISISHTLKVFVPYEYVVTLSNVCNLLSSLLLSAILLTSSVYIHDDRF